MQVPWPAFQAPSKAAGMGSREARERQPVWGARGLRSLPVLSGYCTKRGHSREGGDGEGNEGVKGKEGSKGKCSNRSRRTRPWAIKCRGSVSLQRALGRPRAASTSGPGNHVKSPGGGVSELKPEKLVGTSQVRGWRMAFTKAPKGTKVLRGQKKIDLNVSQSSAALTGLYNGPTMGAFYTFPNFYLQIDLILTSLGSASSHCSQKQESASSISSD